jgi:hypothetical protein
MTVGMLWSRYWGKRVASRLKSEMLLLMAPTTKISPINWPLVEWIDMETKLCTTRVQGRQTDTAVAAVAIYQRLKYRER